jgi:hypothetical protein
VRPLLLTLLVGLALAPQAGARNPRLERLALRPADGAFARGAVLRSADLGSGWKTTTVRPDDTAAPDCPWQDYSRFTITGQAQTRSSRSGASVTSRVEVYRSRRDALGDLAVDAKHRTAACEGAALRRSWSASGVPTRLLSARRLRAPGVGQKSLAFRIVLGVRGKGSQQRLRVYVDLIAFVRDRAEASVTVLTPRSPAKGDAQLARRIDARLQQLA